MMDKCSWVGEEACDDIGNNVGYCTLGVLVANKCAWTNIVRRKGIPKPSVGVLVTAIAKKPSQTTVAQGLCGLISQQWTGTVDYTLLYDRLR